MASPWRPSDLLLQCRRRAGLTQRELASRAGTSQSVVARIESGETSPTAATLEKLFSAAGFEAWIELVQVPVEDSHMLSDVGRIRSLSPEQRLAEVANVARFVRNARRV